MPMKLYAHPDSYMTKKALVAAKYAGLDIENPASGVATSGKIPVLETDQGCIFSSVAIARYISRISRTSGLYGQNLLENGMVDSWVEFSTHELEVPLCTWVLPVMGVCPEVPEATACAKEDVKKALNVLNNHLLHNTYMVGHQITLADISVACALVDGMRLVLDATMRKQFGNLMRWFELCTSQAEFAAVIGTVALCGGAGVKASPKGAPKKEPAPKKEAAPKKEVAPKKEASPKASPKKAPASSSTASGDVEKQITAVGDDIRILKEKLKGEGLSGKKINDHEEVKKLVAQLQELKAQHAAAPVAPAGTAATAAKPASPKQQGKKEKGGKDEKKEGKAPVEKSAEDLAEDAKKKMKKVVKEGGKRGVEIEGAADMGGLMFFCTSVDEPEGNLDLMDACMTAMNKVCPPDTEERSGCSGHVGKMIFSAGVDQLGIVAYLPKELEDKIDAMEWLKKVLAAFGGEMAAGSSAAYAKGFVKANSDKGLFPLKIKEPCITEAIAYLKGKGLFPDGDDDSDEMVFGDDDFPSM